MRIDYQSEFDHEIIKALETRGHVANDSKSAGKVQGVPTKLLHINNIIGSVIGAIARMKNGNIKAKSDSRKSGGVAGIGEVPSSSSSTIFISNIVMILCIIFSIRN